MVSHLPCLLLAIYSAQELEDVVLGVAMFSLDTLRQLHVHVHLDGCLWVSHDDINLSQGLF